MDKVARVVVLIVVILAVSLTARMVTDMGIKEAFNNDDTSRETVMGVTKQEYLDKVSNNGQDKEALCAYEYLIDTYGLKETYKMDLAATKDEEDIHPAIYEAIDRCLQ